MSELTAFELALRKSAIEAVALLGKPVAEVITIPCDDLPALASELAECIADYAPHVKAFIRETEPGYVNYGFFVHSWVLDALDYCVRTDIPEPHLHWIQGLLFGYRPDAIERFLTSSESDATSPVCGISDTTRRVSSPDASRVAPYSTSIRTCLVVDSSGHRSSYDGLPEGVESAACCDDGASFTSSLGGRFSRRWQR
jgi:hypothetical protein